MSEQSPVLALVATDDAKQGLRDLRDSNSELFTVVSAWITAMRAADAEAVKRSGGQTFRLEDDRTARLRTFFDVVAGADLAVVWMVERHDDGFAMKLVAVEHP